MKIGLLGHGVVGSGVDRIVSEYKTEDLGKMEIARILVKDSSQCLDERYTTDVTEILNDPEIDAVCECMGGIEPAAGYVLTALRNGKYAVTSNKKMLASRLEDLLEAAKKNHTGIGYEATTGGGIPWMANLERTARVDVITSFRGIFNGTTNYILYRMAKEKKNFDVLLQEAQALGYAEQDPSDDIDGYDVRYKTVLSCLQAFGTYPEIKSVPVFGIRNITKEDIFYAEKCRKVIKLIGRGRLEDGVLSASVMPVFLDANDVLAQVPLNFNMIESESSSLGKAGYMGQGAGSMPTAHAVVQDLVDCLRTPDKKVPSGICVQADNGSAGGTYYVRTTKPECFASVVKETLENGALLTKDITLEEMLVCVKNAQDDTLFLAEVVEND